jgi:hypothetical protein
MKLIQAVVQHGMFDDDSVSLYRHQLTNGLFADEFLQSQPWSSGPCSFIGLKVSNGTEFVWDQKSIDEG